MKRDVEKLLSADHTGLWVELDVVMEAFDLGQRRAYQLAHTENWRRARGVWPTQYAFSDIRATYRKRKKAAQEAEELATTNRAATVRERLAAKHLAPRR
jgi:hypothetical protein